jgi:hypothetical protein
MSTYLPPDASYIEILEKALDQLPTLLAIALLRLIFAASVCIAYEAFK